MTTTTMTSRVARRLDDDRRLFLAAAVPPSPASPSPARAVAVFRVTAVLLRAALVVDVLAAA